MELSLWFYSKRLLSSSNELLKLGSIDLFFSIFLKVQQIVRHIKHIKLKSDFFINLLGSSRKVEIAYGVDRVRSKSFQVNNHQIWHFVDLHDLGGPYMGLALVTIPFVLRIKYLWL